MHIILQDSEPVRTNLKPLTLTRPTAALLAGINDSIAQRWGRLIPTATIGYETEDYLAEKYPRGEAPEVESFFIAGNVVPDSEFANAVKALLPGQWIANNRGECLARRAGAESESSPVATLSPIEYRSLTDIFRSSKELIARDFDMLTAGRTSAKLPESCTLIGPESLLFIEEGASVEGAMINTKTGPVYISAGADVQECTVLRGPIAIGTNCRVRAGARLLPGVNLGPSTRVGGEVSNTVFLGYANKQHDGYLGDAVIGMWTNIGAECVASNLKNNYSEIKLWNYTSRRFEKTGLSFCGLIMGDHSKAAIDTTFNTATVIGVACNLHGYGFPRAFTPSFSNGGAQGYTRQILKQVIDTETIVMSHRDVKISKADIDILTHIFNDPDA